MISEMQLGTPQEVRGFGRFIIVRALGMRVRFANITICLVPGIITDRLITPDPNAPAQQMSYGKQALLFPFETSCGVFCQISLDDVGGEYRQPARLWWDGCKPKTVQSISYSLLIWLLFLRVDVPLILLRHYTVCK